MLLAFWHDHCFYQQRKKAATFKLIFRGELKSNEKIYSNFDDVGDVGGGVTFIGERADEKFA